MVKTILLILTAILISSSTSTFEEDNKWKKVETGITNQMKNLVKQEEKAEFFKYLNAIAQKESGMNYNVINTIGAMGKYQFIQGTLNSIGFDSITVKKFASNPEVFSPEMQDKAMIKLLSINKDILYNCIQKYSNTVQNGIFITESGILAAAHLAGAFGVRNYFKSNSNYNPSDIYGTSIEDYLKRFGGYNLDFKFYKPLKTI